MTREYNQKVEESLQDLLQAGRYKFMVHSSKGPWTYKTVGILLSELKREVEELEEAIEAGKNKEAIISELGDVCNYAAMILEKVTK